MDKKNRAAFGGFLHGNQKADFAGENPAEYLAPEVSVCDFALENGFSLSTVTEDYGSSGTGSCMESYGNAASAIAAESYGETEPAAAAEGYGSVGF